MNRLLLTALAATLLFAESQAADMVVAVNTAVTVPVNIFPLTDSDDFKSRETSVAYNASGMDLVWNFQTTAGVTTQTAVTPTTSGVYDWTHAGDGMYYIEIPASGGGSINNNAVGTGWFSGVATGVLPWRGPLIQFSPANVSNSLVNGTDRLEVDVQENAAQPRWLYVTKAGNNSNGGLSYADAKLTIAGAVAIARNGDTIWIGDGTYSESLDLDTANLSNITFIGQSRDGTKITASSGYALTCEHGLKLRSIWIDNTSTSANTAAVYLNSKTNFDAEDCTFSGTYDAMVGNGSRPKLRQVNMSGTYDAWNCDGCTEIDAEQVTCLTTGTFSSGTTPARALIALSCSGRFSNCMFQAARGTASAQRTVGAEVGTGAFYEAEFIGCRFFGADFNAGSSGPAVGLRSASNVVNDTHYVSRLVVVGGGCYSSNSGSGGAKDVDVSFDASSFVRSTGFAFSASKYSGDVRTELVPTIPMRAVLADSSGNVRAVDSSGNAVAPASATTALQASVDDVPNNSEFNARTLPNTDYASASNLAAAKAVVDAIKVVSDKLNTGLVLDGSVYKWTANALEEGPSGGGGGGTVSPFLVAKGHSWRFDNSSQTTAPNTIVETAGFEDMLFEMDFSGALNGLASIQSITDVTIADVSGKTEPTVVEDAPRADKKAAIITIDGVGASVNTTGYVVSVEILTTDGQTMTRKGRLVVQ